MAANALWHYGTLAKPAVPALLAIVNDDNSDLSAIAAYSLLGIDPSVPIDQRLLTLLGHKDKQVRYMTAEAFCHPALTLDRVQPAVPKLIELLGDENEEVRFAAVKTLNRVPPSNAVIDALAKAFTSESDADLKRRFSSILFEGKEYP